MLTYLKFLAVGTLASVLATLVGSVGANLIMLAAVVGSGLYLLEKARRLLVTASRLLKHWIDTVQIIQALPPVVGQIAEQLKALDERLASLEQTSTAAGEHDAAMARELGVSHRVA